MNHAIHPRFSGEILLRLHDSVLFGLLPLLSLAQTGRNRPPAQVGRPEPPSLGLPGRGGVGALSDAELPRGLGGAVEQMDRRDRGRRV